MMINRMTKPNCISYSLVLLFGLRIIDIVEQYAHLGTRAKQNLAKALSNILKSKKIYLLIRKQILVRYLVQISKNTKH